MEDQNQEAQQSTFNNKKKVGKEKKTRLKKTKLAPKGDQKQKLVH